jgi:hypothetical protein
MGVCRRPQCTDTAISNERGLTTRSTVTQSLRAIYMANVGGGGPINPLGHTQRGDNGNIPIRPAARSPW